MERAPTRTFYPQSRMSDERTPLRTALYALWRAEHASGASDHEAARGFGNVWDLGGADRVRDVFGESRIEHVAEVELGSEKGRWVFACADGKGRLARFGAEGEFDAVFLGRPTGGQYRETLREQSVAATYLHLATLGTEPLRIVDASRSRTSGIRQLLRTWADSE